VVKPVRNLVPTIEFGHGFFPRVSAGLALLCLAAVPCAAEESPAADDKAPVSIRADEWFPYNGKPGSEWEGFGIEMMREIFGRAGFEVDYQLAPWTRAVEDARQGLIDAVIGATTNEAPGFLFPSESLGMSRKVFFVLRDSPWDYQGPASLEDVRVTAILGYDYGRILNDHIERHRFDSDKIDLMGGVNAFEKNLTKLKRGLVDVMVENPLVFKSQARKFCQDPSRFREAGELPHAEEIYVAFSPARPRGEALRRLWDEGVEAMRQDGRLDRILQRYGLEDWPREAGSMASGRESFHP